VKRTSKANLALTLSGKAVRSRIPKEKWGGEGRVWNPEQGQVKKVPRGGIEGRPGEN